MPANPTTIIVAAIANHILVVHGVFHAFQEQLPALRRGQDKCDFWGNIRAGRLELLVVAGHDRDVLTTRITLVATGRFDTKVRAGASHGRPDPGQGGDGIVVSLLNKTNGCGTAARKNRTRWRFGGHRAEVVSFGGGCWGRLILLSLLRLSAIIAGAAAATPVSVAELDSRLL
jgi:hypothetical protein